MNVIVFNVTIGIRTSLSLGMHCNKQPYGRLSSHDYNYVVTQ